MNNILENLFNNYSELIFLENDIKNACNILIKSFDYEGKLLVCGNGGSAADSEHIVGELMKGFRLKRAVNDEKIPIEIRKNLQGALPAISLTGAISLSTAFANDVNPEFVFAQQVYGLGRKNDVLIAISTSGNAKNVCNAVEVAKAKEIKTIGLTGQKGGKLGEMCDVTIKVPSNETYRIQEYHLPIYHAICEILETEYFSI